MALRFDRTKWFNDMMAISDSDGEKYLWSCIYHDAESWVNKINGTTVNEHTMMIDNGCIVFKEWCVED